MARTDVCIMTLLILQMMTTESGLLIHRKHSISKRAFVSTPNHTVATVDEEVRLECSTDLNDPMTWHFTSSDGTYNDDIYYSLIFVHHMESRYKMDTSKKGQYTLVIPKVDRGHAGEYRCDDDEGATKGREPVQLVVIESRPRCDVIGGKSKVVQLNCSINAVGNLNIILTHPKYTVPQPKKTNNNVYSVVIEAELAKTCHICFTAGSDGSTCVFQTDLDDYRSSTTIPASEGSPIQDKQVGAGRSRTTITAVIVVVVVIVCVVGVSVVLYFVFKRNRQRETRDAEEEAGAFSDTTPSNADSQPASPTGSEAPLLEGKDSSHPY